MKWYNNDILLLIKDAKGDHMKKRVLIIEDNHVAAKAIATKLKDEVFEVEVVHDGKHAIDTFDRGNYDVILLDLVLPGKSGEEVLRYIRSKSEIPVIILSAKDTDVEKAINLGLGADDYLAKPFSMLELVARVKAVLRRSGQMPSTTVSLLEIGHLRIDLNHFLVTKNGEPLSLTSKEFSILRLLATNPNQTFSKQDIYMKIWGETYYDNDNVINVHIRRLREKIEDEPSTPKIIKTKWGFGYHLGLEVHEVESN
jgi:two-component system, OmpR family, response regulator VicR